MTYSSMICQTCFFHQQNLTQIMCVGIHSRLSQSKETAAGYWLVFTQAVCFLEECYLTYAHPWNILYSNDMYTCILAIYNAHATKVKHFSIRLDYTLKHTSSLQASRNWTEFFFSVKCFGCDCCWVWKMKRDRKRVRNGKGAASENVHRSDLKYPAGTSLIKQLTL